MYKAYLKYLTLSFRRTYFYTHIIYIYIYIYIYTYIYIYYNIYIYILLIYIEREILLIESVLSGTFCMRGQKLVLKFCILWGQFVSRNNLPCSTQDGRLNHFIKVSSTLLSTFLLAFKII